MIGRIHQARCVAEREQVGQRMSDELRIRPVRDTDAPILAALVNEIIAYGGTTALEEPFTPAELIEAMLTGPDVYCCFVAENAARELLGFQALTRSDHMPAGVGDIGTRRGVLLGDGTPVDRISKRLALTPLKAMRCVEKRASSSSNSSVMMTCGHGGVGRDGWPG